VVDDEGGDGALGGFELEAQLFLESGEEVGGPIGGAVVGGVVGLIFGGPLEPEVVVAGEASFVDDGVAELIGEDFGERRQGDCGCSHVVVVDVDVAAAFLTFLGVVGIDGRGRISFEPGTVFGNDEVEDGEGFDFGVSLDVETVGKHGEKHGFALLAGEVFEGVGIEVGDLGGDVEVRGVGPAGKAGDEVFADSVSVGDELFEGAVGGDEVAGARVKHGVIVHRVVRVDGDDIIGRRVRDGGYLLGDRGQGEQREGEQRECAICAACGGHAHGGGVFLWGEWLETNVGRPSGASVSEYSGARVWVPIR
jgi:hypothetical protein